MSKYCWTIMSLLYMEHDTGKECKDFSDADQVFKVGANSTNHPIIC